LSSEPEFLEKHIPMRTIPFGRFKVPKFKISFGFEASDLLRGLGFQLPLSEEANLSELVVLPVGQNLRVSSIIHKSFVEVNEEGTRGRSCNYYKDYAHVI
jgi:serpin B